MNYPNWLFDFRYFKKTGLEEIFEKVQSGTRLSIDDGQKLFECSDAIAIGNLAHLVRTRLHKRFAYYVINQHINYSNICVNGCRFCAFGKEKNHSQAFELSLEDISETISKHSSPHLTEIHIVGGCHPDLPFSYYENLIREVKTLRPTTVIKAFTPVEIHHFSQVAGISTHEVLARLKSAGLDMLPGGGAEIFSPRVREALCPRKLSGKDWLKISKEAHQLGIRTNATMLYGHIETQRERLEHLIALRDLQDMTGGFVCFIPLPFQTANSALTGIQPTTGLEDLKTIAISRLMLDNFSHIKAYWVMLTVKLAQVALYFGADDFDGTVVEEKIGHMAGAQSEQALTRSDLERTIREAGFEPVERNAFFEPVSNR